MSRWVNDFELIQVFLCLPNTLSVNNVQFSFFTIGPLMGTDNPFKFQRNIGSVITTPELFGSIQGSENV